MPATGTDSRPMNADDLRARVTARSRWRHHNEQAPHKPLLLLLALADFLPGVWRWVHFADVEPRLPALLTEFGPPKGNPRAEYPFWRLQTDGLWTVQHAEAFKPNASGDVPVTQLRSADAAAGFTDEVHRLLKSQPRLAGDLINRILDAHFPETLHEDIRQAIGLEEEIAEAVEAGPELDLVTTTRTNRRRDPHFRELVLRAHGYQCTICGFSLRLGDASWVWTRRTFSGTRPAGRRCRRTGWPFALCATSSLTGACSRCWTG